jgi:hypothetical protein
MASHKELNPVLPTFSRKVKQTIKAMKYPPAAKM